MHHGLFSITQTLLANGYYFVFVNPLTAGPDYIRRLHFFLVHYISAFKHVKR